MIRLQLPPEVACFYSGEPPHLLSERLGQRQGARSSNEFDHERKDRHTPVEEGPLLSRAALMHMSQ